MIELLFEDKYQLHINENTPEKKSRPTSLSANSTNQKIPVANNNHRTNRLNDKNVQNKNLLPTESNKILSSHSE